MTGFYIFALILVYMIFLEYTHQPKRQFISFRDKNDQTHSVDVSEIILITDSYGTNHITIHLKNGQSIELSRSILEAKNLYDHFKITSL